MDELKADFEALAAMVDEDGQVGYAPRIVALATALGMTMIDESEASDINRVFVGKVGHAKLTLRYMLIPVEPGEQYLWVFIVQLTHHRKIIQERNWRFRGDNV